MGECSCKSVLPAYRLLKPAFGLPAGTIFVHDESDSVLGSPAHGCMKLAWVNGSCQAGWCGHVFILPGQMASDAEWFAHVQNPVREAVYK
jgi:hypothetical protein